MKAIKKMKTTRPQEGASVSPAEALKALPKTALYKLHNLLTDFWTGKVLTHKEWQEGIFVILYKKKLDKKVLHDFFARLTSIIITGRLDQLIKSTGVLNNSATFALLKPYTPSGVQCNFGRLTA